DRPGRVLRNFACDHAYRADLFRGRRAALLCVEHAGRGAPHVHLCADQCHVPLLLELATYGLEGACERHASLKKGVNTYNGYVTHAGVAASQGRTFKEL